MLPSDVIRVLIATLTVFSILVAGLSTAAAVYRLVRRRRVGPWTLRALLIAGGFLLGFIILLTEAVPAARLSAVLLGSVVVVVTFWTRPATGGLALLAIATPWTLYWASFLLDNAIGGRRWVLTDVIPPLIVGVTAAFLGIGLFVVGRGPERIRHQAAQPEHVERKFGALAQAIIGPKLFAMATYELATALVLFVIGISTATLVHGRPPVESAVIVVVGVLIAWAACCVAWAEARRPSDRRATEAFTWLAEWELDRYRAQVGGPTMPTTGDFRKWLKSSADLPELRWIRAELLLMENRLDEARVAAEGIPDEPYGRVERAAALAAIDWRQGGPGDAAAIRAAADAIVPDDSEERMRADVNVAMAESRRRLGEGASDPAKPLREVRDRLGSRADGILWTALRKRLWSKLLLTSAFVVVACVVLDRLTTAG